MEEFFIVSKLVTINDAFQHLVCVTTNFELAKEYAKNKSLEDVFLRENPTYIYHVRMDEKCNINFLKTYDMNNYVLGIQRFPEPIIFGSRVYKIVKEFGCVPFSENYDILYHEPFSYSLTNPTTKKEITLKLDNMNDFVSFNLNYARFVPL